VFAGAGRAGKFGLSGTGATNVAIQPIHQYGISLTPLRNEVSLLDPTACSRLAIISTGQNATASVAPQLRVTTPAPSNVSLQERLPWIACTPSFAREFRPAECFRDSAWQNKNDPNSQVITPAIDAPTTPVPAQLSQAVKITSAWRRRAIGPVRYGRGLHNPSQVRSTVWLCQAGVTFCQQRGTGVTIP